MNTLYSHAARLHLMIWKTRLRLSSLQLLKREHFTIFFHKGFFLQSFAPTLFFISVQLGEKHGIQLQKNKELNVFPFPVVPVLFSLRKV